MTEEKICEVFAPGTLGDALIYLTLAHNLQKNGYHVTFYHNHLFSMNDWFKGVDIKMQSEYNKTDDRFLIVDESMRGRLDSALAPIVTSMTKKPSKHKRAACTDSLLLNLHQVGFASAGGRNVMPHVHAVVEILRKVAGLGNVENSNGVCLPNDLPDKDLKRTVICPTSGSSLKNWPAKKFIRLAGKLKKQGYQPVFSMAPKEKVEWEPLLKGRFEIADTRSVAELAELLACSAAFIGNDSGAGHLASCLNIPLVTILGKRSKDYRWAPGWRPAEIVIPFMGMAPKLFGKRIWKPFISVRRVFKAFKRLGV